MEPFNDRELERLLKSFKKDPKGNILKMFENVLKNVLECPKNILEHHKNVLEHLRKC